MLRLSFFVLLIATLVPAGCGSSDSPTGPSVGGPSTFSETLPGTVAVFSESRHAFSAPISGNLTLRLTWGDGSVDLDLYLANSSCSMSLYPLDNCDIVAESIASTGTSETVRRTVAAGQQYQVWVDNLSLTTTMNYTLSIVID